MCAYKRISPTPIVEGGTGAQTLTSNGVLLGNTTSAITATAAGNTGQVLTGVTGLAPTFQAPAASSISITGDTGGALTGNAFTFTAGTTGLSFGGSGSTETLSGTLVVSNGGTGRATLTNHGVLIGAATTAISQTAAGTTGQVLTGVTGSDPVWASPAASSISITGDTGGALTGNAFTFTGGTTGLKFGGATSTETLSGTLVVANGGTGATSLTGILTGNGTSTVTANAVTQHGVLIGGASNAASSLGVAATGTVLSGNTAADPSFTATPSVTSIALSGGSALSTFTDWTTFTPTVTGASTAGTTTYVTQAGTYSRIGNMVFISFSVTYSAATGTGNLLIGGLPFTSNAAANGVYTGSVLDVGLVWPAGTTSILVIVGPSVNTAFIYASGSGISGGVVQMLNGVISIQGSFMYRV